MFPVVLCAVRRSHGIDIIFKIKSWSKRLITPHNLNGYQECQRHNTIYNVHCSRFWINRQNPCGAARKVLCRRKAYTKYNQKLIERKGEWDKDRHGTYNAFYRHSSHIFKSQNVNRSISKIKFKFPQFVHFFFFSSVQLFFTSFYNFNTPIEFSHLLVLSTFNVSDVLQIEIMQKVGLRNEFNSKCRWSFFISLCAQHCVHFRVCVCDTRNDRIVQYTQVPAIEKVFYVRDFHFFKLQMSIYLCRQHGVFLSLQANNIDAYCTYNLEDWKLIELIYCFIESLHLTPIVFFFFHRSSFVVPSANT